MRASIVRIRCAAAPRPWRVAPGGAGPAGACQHDMHMRIVLDLVVEVLRALKSSRFVCLLVHGTPPRAVTRRYRPVPTGWTHRTALTTFVVCDVLTERMNIILVGRSPGRRRTIGRGIRHVRCSSICWLHVATTDKNNKPLTVTRNRRFRYTGARSAPETQNLDLSTVLYGTPLTGAAAVGGTTGERCRYSCRPVTRHIAGVRSI